MTNVGNKANSNAQNHIQITSYHTVLLLFLISFLATAQLECKVVIYICLLHSLEITKGRKQANIDAQQLSNSDCSLYFRTFFPSVLFFVTINVQFSVIDIC